MTNPTQLEAWLKGFPKQETEVRIQELEHELTTLRNAVAMHDSLSSRQNGSAATTDDPDTEPANRPDAIRRVLRESGSQMAPGSIKATLIERAWLADTEPASKRFYSTLYQMTKRGHVLRLHDGRYVLPPARAGGD